MKRLTLLLLAAALCCALSGCGQRMAPDIAATTAPVYDFTVRLCEGTGLSVTRLVTESVSCLHDYTLQVGQMQAIQGARAVVISGAGLEGFLEDALESVSCVIDSSEGLALLEGDHHDHGHSHDHEHTHAEDPHIWLSPANAKAMAHNICHGLSQRFPEFAGTFETNLVSLLAQLDQLQTYGEKALGDLSCRELITFHDGFSYLAESFGLEILEAVEEESGSEASAAQLIGLCRRIEAHRLKAVFTEKNGSVSAAEIIAAETGAAVYALDMAMSGDSYFDAMYYNINTLREALE